MMGKNRIIFLAILVGAVTSCGWKDPDAETLREAEMVMTESPDSALAILHGINESDIKDAIRHKYVVLKAQAECKLNINSGEDKSALREASEYFKKKNELHYLTLAEYYLGVRYEDDYAESMAHCLNAEEAAKKANDDFYLGLAYREMGAIYGACNSFEQELIYMRQALEYLKKANIKDYADYALETLGDALVNNEKYKEAEEVGREIVAIAGERGDSI